MYINKMTEIVRMYQWESFRFVPYVFSGIGGCKAYKWILHLGFFRIIRYRIIPKFKTSQENI